MKVAINVCFGGFSLSPLGIKEYAKRKRKKAYFFEGGLSKPYSPITLKEATNKGIFISAFSVPNPNDYKDKKEWHEMTDKERGASNKKHEKISLSNGRDLERDDPDLIAVIEKLGTEKASGRFSKLKIVEIPDSVKYSIEEYDGNEHIAEVHKTWS